jgi:hypothetical protein
MSPASDDLDAIDDAPAARVRMLAGALLLAAVVLVLGAPIAWALGGRTAGDSTRMATAGAAAELVGIVASGVVVNILKKRAHAQRSARWPNRGLRAALAVARVTFWSAMLLVALLSCGALLSLAISFGVSG